MPLAAKARAFARRLVRGPYPREPYDKPGPLPDFVILGAQKAGTTTLFLMLAAHPQISRSTVKEVHYFDLNHERGEDWYRRHFKKPITGESSPYYLFHPQVPDRMRALIPRARLIAILRDPVERAISHYFHNIRHAHEPLPMLEALQAEDTRTGAFSHQHHSYVARSRYMEQLDRWAGFDLLVLSNRELRADPQGTFARACRHIGIEPRRTRMMERNVGEKGETPPEARRFLEERLAGEKEAVEQRYGIVL